MHSVGMLEQASAAAVTGLKVFKLCGHYTYHQF